MYAATLTIETNGGDEDITLVRVLDAGDTADDGTLEFNTTTVNTTRTMTVDFQLGLAQIQESLTVSGQAPLVESTQSGLSHTILQTEVAQLNEVVHVWAYRDLNDRAAVRGKVLQDPEWQAFLSKATPLLIEMRSIALIPAPSSPMK